MTAANTWKLEQGESSLRKYGVTLGAIAVCNAVGIGTGVLTTDAMDSWYRGLEKPSFNPPSWVFGPVWTVMYTLMGITLGILWRARGKGPDANPALALFAIQLMLNSLWSFVFFRWKSPGWALVEIVVLLAAIAMTIRAAWKVSPTAGALMIPYLAWVAFAAVLNLAIWRMNS